MLKYLSVLLLICLIFFSVPSAFADNPTCNRWRFEIAPYLWAINLNGTEDIGAQHFAISENFNDILKQLDYGGMLYLSANKGRWGFFLNSVYAVLSDTTTLAHVNIKGTNHFGIFTGGISYEVFRACFCRFGQMQEIYIEPYLGARFTLDNSTITILNTSVSDNQNWTDPIVGARFTYLINPQWRAIFSADGGGTNLHFDYSYNAAALAGFTPPRWNNTTFYLGYRYLFQHYTTGVGINRFGWNMNIFGPVLGVAFGF